MEQSEPFPDENIINIKNIIIKFDCFAIEMDKITKKNDYVFNDPVLANYSREIRVWLTKNSKADISCRFIPSNAIFGNTSVTPFVVFTSDGKRPMYITAVVENPSNCRPRITICLTV